MPSPASPTTHAQIHNAASVMSLLATIAGLLVLAKRFSHEPHWKGWSRYAVLTAALMIAFLAAFGATNNGGPGGMFEKLASITALMFSITLIGRLLTHDARLSQPPRHIRRAPKHRRAELRRLLCHPQSRAGRDARGHAGSASPTDPRRPDDLTALIQLLDAITAATTARLELIPIDLAFAAVFILGAAHLSGQRLPRRSARQRPPLTPRPPATSPSAR